MISASERDLVVVTDDNAGVVEVVSVGAFFVRWLLVDEVTDEAGEAGELDSGEKDETEDDGEEEDDEEEREERKSSSSLLAVNVLVFWQSFLVKKSIKLKVLYKLAEWISKIKY